MYKALGLNANRYREIHQRSGSDMVTNEMTEVALPQASLNTTPPKALLRILVLEDSLHDFQLCV
jgi:hypothetical protein